ncbi:MAG TPA: cold shock domain-containing protein [Gemmatimonadales bacterium]|nr:cold shock domain-containing protein [Gemmatimonadales bacterium]
MRVLGKVKWFDLVRCFGVIGRANGDSECLVHHSAIRGTMCNPLAEGEPVEFEVVQGGGGATARDVIRLGWSFAALEVA